MVNKDLHAMEHLLREDFLLQLEHLKSDTPPQWGRMSSQHMVEHVIGSLRISNGKYTARLAIAEDQVPVRKAFLMSEQSFPKNVKNPALPDGLVELKFKSLADAVAALKEEMQKFFTFFEDTPQNTPVHPVFGSLNRAEWIQFHTKHFKHHLAQFAIT